MSAVTVVAIPIQIGSFKLQIRSPGNVRHLAFERKPKLVMTRGEAGFEEVPVMFVEATKGAPLINRTYTCVEHGHFVEPNEGESAEWRATGLSGAGLIVHLFEIIAEGS